MLRCTVEKDNDEPITHRYTNFGTGLVIGGEVAILECEGKRKNYEAQMVGMGVGAMFKFTSPGAFLLYCSGDPTGTYTGAKLSIGCAIGTQLGYFQKDEGSGYCCLAGVEGGLVISGMVEKTALEIDAVY